jgi:ssDNA-binding Zn-finger/Zn-ribbon topoisomerase 1
MGVEMKKKTKELLLKMSDVNKGIFNDLPEEKPGCWCEDLPEGGITFAKNELKTVLTAELNFCPQCGRKL